MLNVVLQNKDNYAKETLVAYTCDNNFIRFRTLDNQQGKIQYKSREEAKEVFLSMVKQEEKELQLASGKVLFFDLLWLPTGYESY